MRCLPSMRIRTFVISLVAGWLAVSGTAKAEEPCNPIVDGTYCATQMLKKGTTTSSSGRMKAIDDMTRLVPSSSVGNTAPGTLVGISFQGGGSCFGLLRRSVCD
jgi:hypothetical protein